VTAAANGAPCLVSVITPAYNVAPYLDACIESVLRQTVRDLEMIVVDDGSSDDTPRVAAGHAARDARVRLVRIENQGVSRARNTAMANSKGNLIALLDGDDEWDPRFLAEQLAVFERMPHIDVVSGNAFNRGGPSDGQPVRRWPVEVRELRIRDMVEREDTVFIMSVFRRIVFETTGGFDASLTRSEDYDFWLRAASAGFRFAANPAPLGYYRRRPDSASADELAMLQAITNVLRRLEPSALDEDTRAAIHRVLDELDSRYLTARAKASLLAREYGAAARDFHALSRLRGNSSRYAALALLSRACPGLLRSMYKARKAKRG
jgi:Glycosyl transferase family 2